MDCGWIKVAPDALPENELIAAISAVGRVSDAPCECKQVMHSLRLDLSFSVLVDRLGHLFIAFFADSVGEHWQGRRVKKIHLDNGLLDFQPRAVAPHFFAPGTHPQQCA